MGTSRARYLIVQVVDTLAIDVGEPRVITRVPGQRFALTITDHEPEISKFKKGPAADPVVLVESKLVDKKCDRGGARLGSYEITDPLGTGGVGAVYRAKSLKLGRDVRSRR
jgi:hypothetical protein